MTPGPFDPNEAAMPPTLGALFDWIGPGLTPVDYLAWPPDIFAVALAALQKSGAYLQIVECAQWPPPPPVWGGKQTSSWHQFIRHVGRRWREHTVEAAKQANAVVPPGLADTVEVWLQQIFAQRQVVLSDLKHPRNVQLRHSLHQLVAAADEAFAGVGFRAGNPGSIYSLGATQISVSGRRSLCRKISPEVLVVLPKQHTPQTGMTIRTLTHHLGLCWGGEVTPQWNLALSNILNPLDTAEPTTTSATVAQADLPLNILIVPWPSRVLPTQFAPAPWSLSCHNHGTHGFFAFKPGATPSIAEKEVHFKAIHDAAKEMTGRIDGVIFPELALNGDEEVERLGRAFLQWNSSGFFIAGVGVESPPPGPGANKACLMFKIGSTHVHREDQYKHHRWQVEQRQIDAFGLGAMLNPFVRWWEHIQLDQRTLTFMPFTPSLTATVLICEDLARQEPASELIRAVGPNLVVALLMDGPQLASRWPSRYATVLADDPGSSVLTVTSLGMCELSRPGGAAPLRVIAQWKDSVGGVREITLPVSADAVVLSLANRMTTEWTADGRSDGGLTNLLALSGIYPVKAPRAGLSGSVAS